MSNAYSRSYSSAYPSASSVYSTPRPAPSSFPPPPRAASTPLLSRLERDKWLHEERDTLHRAVQNLVQLHY